MEATWESRDLPVLDAIVRFFEDNVGNFPAVRDIASATGLDALDVFRACRALDGTYIELRMVMAGGDPNPHHVMAVTDAARRAVGQWPSGEAWVDRLVRSLSEAAEEEPDPERRSKLRSAAEVLGGMAREVAVAVMSSGIGHATGL